MAKNNLSLSVIRRTVVRKVTGLVATPVIAFSSSTARTTFTPTVKTQKKTSAHSIAYEAGVDQNADRVILTNVVKIFIYGG